VKPGGSGEWLMADNPQTAGHPILFGVLLIGTAIVLRRWLATGAEGARRGFTATRLLRSDKDALDQLGIASAAFHQGPAHAHTEPPDPFKGKADARAAAAPRSRRTSGAGRSGGPGGLIQRQPRKHEAGREEFFAGLAGSALIVRGSMAA
jgi:hypothetical protein